MPAQSLRCDGCARAVGPEHIRRRIARLEWSSRFRPVHIAALLLTPAPPAQLEDFFYFPGAMPGEPAARALVEDVFETCAIPLVGGSREPALRAFQHRGLFLADCIECPLEDDAPLDFDSLLAALIPTLVRRVQFSYRPKSLVLLSHRLSPEFDALSAFPQRSSLELPDPLDLAARARFRAQFAPLLAT
jgi:hypothetical protein